jgi:hypothetical protein
MLAMEVSLCDFWPYSHASSRLLPPQARPKREPVLNVETEVRPGEETRLCLRLPAGRVSVTLRADESRGTVPIRFLFGHADVGDSERIVTMVASEPSTHALTIRGGLYCYTLIHEGHDPSAPMPRIQGAARERPRAVLRALSAVDHGRAGRAPSIDDDAEAFVTNAVVGAASMDQPTTRREYVSSTTAQYTVPSRVGCSVISVTHNWSGSSRAN